MTDDRATTNSPGMDIAELIARHHEGLYGYAYRLTGSAADAEDLLQQVFLIAHQKGHQIREGAAVRSWLFAVLRNCHFKNCRRREPMLAENIEMDLEDTPDSVPEEDWFDREQLQQAIDDLPLEFKLVVLMFYFEECSYREIAEKLDVPIGTVMSRLSRAKRHLRTKLIGGSGHKTAAATK